VVFFYPVFPVSPLADTRIRSATLSACLCVMWVAGVYDLSRSKGDSYSTRTTLLGNSAADEEERWVAAMA
jgi:hypothetical protein